MSWLLVALIPGLLMFATIGLQRVESALNTDTVSDADVAGILEQAKGHGAEAGPKAARDQPVRRLSPRIAVPMSEFDKFVSDVPTGPLPTPRYAFAHPNPEFQRTRHPDRV